MADTLYPHFLGGSLGWHDFLGSTARLLGTIPIIEFREGGSEHRHQSYSWSLHQILAEALDPIGAIKIGGMYGILYEEGNAASFEICMVGFIKDVFTQMKRGLDGFWVLHPSFVRIGIAMVEAWRRHQSGSDLEAVPQLVRALVPNPQEHEPLIGLCSARRMA